METVNCHTSSLRTIRANKSVELSERRRRILTSGAMWNITLFIAKLYLILAYCVMSISADGVAVSVPQTVNVSLREPATIPCTYIGDKQDAAPETVRWTRDVSKEILVSKTGEAISGKWFDEGHATVVDQASLRIFSAAIQDAGKYTCSVGTSYGTAELRVDGKPKIQTGPYDELDLAVNQTLELTCRGVGQLSWEWPKHDDKTATVLRVPRDPDAPTQTIVLRIDQVSTANTGEYRCIRTEQDYTSGYSQTWTSDPVYVYVISVEAPLFLEADKTNLVHFWGQSSIVPCRLTNRNANVTLLPDEVFSDTSPEAMTFNPRVGFNVAAGVWSDYQGNVSCRAVLGEKVDVQSFTVDFVGKPSLSVQVPNMTISEYSTLELNCTGVQRMQWLTPDGLGDRLDILHTTTYAGTQPAVYHTSLRVTQTIFTDTGEYSCIYQRYIKFEKPLLKASVYVFVKSLDPDKIFVTPKEQNIYLETGQEPLTVPCRITDPSKASDVKLRAFYTQTSAVITNFESQWAVTYDPKAGFHLIPTFYKAQIRQMTLGCNIADKLLTFKPVIEGDNAGEDFFKASIEPSAKRLIQGRDSFSVNCIISIPILTYPSWTLLHQPKIEFTYPNKEVIPEGNVYEVNVPHPVSSVLKVEKKLTISNVSMLNNGTYTCRFYNIELNTTYNTTLNVLERGFVQLSRYPVDEDRVVGVRDQEEVCLQAQMESFPEATFRWSKDDVPLTNQTAPRFSADAWLQNNSRVISGCLGNLTVGDGGFYTLTAMNEYDRKTLTIQLDVLEPPEVNLTVTPPAGYQDPPLYFTQQEYQLECRARGKPLPQISWQWRGCRGPLCSGIEVVENEREWTPNPSGTQSRTTASSDAVVSVLTVREPPQSGVFRCLARSPSERIPEPAYADLEFRLTDFNISIPALLEEEHFHTADQVSLTCKTSIYAFSNTVTWDWNPDGNNASAMIQISAEDDRLLDPVMVRYHYESVLVIDEAWRNDSGRYRCWARQRRTGESMLVFQVQLNVDDVTVPVITKKLQPTYSLDRKGVTPPGFKLECRARGDPVPSFEWYKDRQPLTVNNMSVMNLNHTVQKEEAISTLSLVPRITLAHGGTYKCLATSKGGAAYSKGVILVGERPTVSIESSVDNLRVGDDLVLRCQATGKPAPSIVWKWQTADRESQDELPINAVVEEGNSLFFTYLSKDNDGNYICEAVNEHGTDRSNISLSIRDSAQPYTKMFLIFAVIGGTIFVILIICLLAMTRRLFRYKRRNKHEGMELGPVNPRSPRIPMSPFRKSFREEFGDQLPFDSKWEFPRDRLKLGSVIGQGAFGMVLKGVAAGINKNDRYVPVAVKTVKSEGSFADRKALFGELKMLIYVGHHLNVVNFLGACTQDSPPLVIVEYCPYGNLCEYVRSKRDNFFDGKPPKSEQEENTENELNYADLLLKEACVSEPLAAEYELVDKEAKRVAELRLSVEDLVCFCFQVARGMEFLASRKCIHRDLAARNVLLADNNVVKICDFGLSRSLYHDTDYIGSGKGLLPIKWMAPEAIFDKIFTTYSDIWSFGIFTWEIFSLGGSPYPGIQVDERFYDKMKSGYRMSCPEHAPREVYQLMLECWSDEPKDRPMFSELAQKFGELLETNTRQEYIDLNIPYQEGQYCELDFAKVNSGQKPDTIFEDAEPASSKDNTDTLEDGASGGHFEDPTYHRGSKVEASLTNIDETLPMLTGQQPQLQEQKSLEIQDAANQEPEASTSTEAQSEGILPEDPYSREGEQELHTYASVKGARPGFGSPANGFVRSRNAADGLSSPDDGEDRLHMYASIKGARANNGLASKLSPTDPDKGLDRNHLYSSIRGSGALSTPNRTPQEDGSHSSPTEGTTLLSNTDLQERGDDNHSASSSPSRDRPSDGEFRLQGPPVLPRREFSTVSWSPETETLLSASDSPDKQLRPVYV